MVRKHNGAKYGLLAEGAVDSFFQTRCFIVSIKSKER